VMKAPSWRAAEETHFSRHRRTGASASDR